MARWIELRRHAFTKKGDARGRGSHLSQAGVDAARAEGQRLGQVAYVAVSGTPRTMETAIAMGFAVDDEVAIANATASGEVAFHEWWDWPDPWQVFRGRIDDRPALASFADEQAAIVRAAVAQVRDGETALLVGHGGWIEPTVIALVARDELQNWGRSFDHLGGMRLRLDDRGYHVEEVHRPS